MKMRWLLVLCAVLMAESAGAQRILPSFHPTGASMVDSHLGLDFSWTDLDGEYGPVAGLALGTDVGGVVSGVYFDMLADDVEGDDATIEARDFWQSGIYGEGPLSKNLDAKVAPFFGYKFGVAHLTAVSLEDGKSDSGYSAVLQPELGLRLLGSHLSLGVGYRLLVGPEVAGLSAWEWSGVAFNGHLRISF